MADHRQVLAATARQEARTLGEIGTGRSATSTNRSISAASADPSASSITMMSPVSGHESALQRSAFALALLPDDAHVGSQVGGHLDGVVHRPSVDDDHLGDAVRQPAQGVGQVPRLVERRHHDRHRRRPWPLRATQATGFAGHAIRLGAAARAPEMDVRRSQRCQRSSRSSLWGLLVHAAGVVKYAGCSAHVPQTVARYTRLRQSVLKFAADRQCGSSDRMTNRPG